MFSCAALAFPAHITQWTFIDSSGEAAIIISTYEGNNSKYAIDNSTLSPDFGQLVVLNTEYPDRGQYMCTAINEVDDSSALAYLTVHGTHIVILSSVLRICMFLCSSTSDCVDFSRNNDKYHTASHSSVSGHWLPSSKHHMVQGWRPTVRRL